MKIGVIIVDHGSRMAESNQLLECMAGGFAIRFKERFPIVEPAHMELAEPSIATALERCVQRGAREILVVPYFLGPGKHWTKDIPALANEAAAHHPGTTVRVTACLGYDEAIIDVLGKRAQESL